MGTTPFHGFRPLRGRSSLSLSARGCPNRVAVGAHDLAFCNLCHYALPWGIKEAADIRLFVVVDVIEM